MRRIVINGAAGRVGQRLIFFAEQDPQVTIAAATECAGHPHLGLDCGVLASVGETGVVLKTLDQISDQADALIDFSDTVGAKAAIEYCLKADVPLVMATTGLESPTLDLLNQAAQSLPIVWAPNMSLAVNLGMKLVEVASATLAQQDAQVDVEIIERHHRYKADSPSGTALKFGQIIAQQMGQTEHRHGREGLVGQRPASEIGYHAVRTGDNAGEHTIVFGILGETLEVKVAASNRDCYALGAIAAAKFVSQQPPGMYSMMDVLGL